MPRSKAKRKKKAGARRESDIAWGGKASPGARHINIGLGAIVVILTVAGGAYWFLSAESERSFQAVADQGRMQLADLVTTHPDQGRGHGQHGAAYHYGDQFPTSGFHDPVPTSAGVYRVPQRPGQLVHALEHGNIVIYYDQPGPETLATLKDWAGLYEGTWDGVVLTPMDGLGDQVVLNAWTKTLRLKSFDPALAAAFIDRYRGRGPENPVRVDLE
jgi:hypothetical protein